MNSTSRQRTSRLWTARPSSEAGARLAGAGFATEPKPRPLGSTLRYGEGVGLQDLAASVAKGEAKRGFASREPARPARPELRVDATGSERARLIAHLLERVHNCLESALEAMEDVGLDEWTAEAYVELSVGFKAGYADTTTDGVERLAGHPARDFETFANDYKAAFS